MNLPDGKPDTPNPAPMVQSRQLPRLLLIGLNHTSAPVDLRECLAFSDAENERALSSLKRRDAVEEVLILSTCNRMEVLLTTHDPAGAEKTVKSHIAETKSVPVHRFEPAMYIYSDDAAVRHVFRVAASLDSMIVGEPQILGQVKSAYKTAVDNKGAGVIINISTFAAFEPDPLFPTSGVFRAGLTSFTKLFADRYAAANLRMNNVLPGFIESLPEKDERRERIPMERYGSTREISDVIAFLASDGASYITGQNLRVDGGLTRSV